jgi:hypothetical protein
MAQVLLRDEESRTLATSLLSEKPGKTLQGSPLEFDPFPM